jgi:hypothetical protein
MDHLVRCPKETLLHLPALVPAGSTNWPASASLSESGLSGGSPAEEAKNNGESVIRTISSRVGFWIAGKPIVRLNRYAYRHR